MNHIESFATNINDHNLATDHDDIDSHEEPVARDSFKDVELVIKTTVTKFSQYRVQRFGYAKYLLPLIEDLHPHKCVEDKSWNLGNFAVGLI